ncbi:MAG: tetratricopeptide repeat protein [Planctomycetota bacterium]|nr:tetratricopeptide repeat protein [Planctomycetota bacterium]
MTAPDSNPSSTAKPTPARAIVPIVAAILVALLYAAGSWSNQFVYDDHEVIENQFPVHDTQDLIEIFRRPHYLNFPYYRPLTRSTFALQKTIWGDSPRAYHLFNAVLAGLVMLAAYLLLCRPAVKLSWPVALIAALWFSLHPAISECVYPAASGRETLMPALMILLAVWAYLHRDAAWYGAAMLFFIAALLCKEQAAVIPGIFVLADLLLINDGPTNRKTIASSILRWAPAFCILIVYFIIRRAVLGQTLPAVAIAEHPFEPLLSIVYGLQTAVMPFMSLHYEPTFHVWFRPQLTSVAIGTAVILFVILFRADSATRRIALFWAGWFVLLQLPTAHLVRQEAAYSERYAALAILAFPGIAGLIWSQMKREDRAGRPKLPLAASAIAFTWVVVLGGFSFLRGASYADDNAFCAQWVATNPDSATAHAGLASVAQERHELPAAIAEYQRALQLDPHLSSAHNGLANILSEQGDLTGASAHYQELLQDDPRNIQAMVGYAQTLGQLAFTQHDSAARDRARALLDRAIAINPSYPQAHYILAIWHQAFGTQAAARSELQQALRLQPNWPEARKRLDALTDQPNRSHAHE